MPSAADDDSVTLPDGARVVIRPLTRADGPELARGIEHLSARSIHRRFLGAAPPLTPATLRYLTDVDHRDHEALGARDAETGEGVGVARFVRDRREPGTAEIAVAVADAWQHRGVGAELLHRLVARARAEGVTRLIALVLADNQPMLELLAGLGDLERRPAGSGAVEVAVALSPA